jgi:hypothetical protein
MRIMTASACKRDASKTHLFQQGNPEKQRGCSGFNLCNCRRRLHAIEALDCGMIVIKQCA